YVAKDNSFYASLHAVTTPQDLQMKSCSKESNENVEIVDISAFTNFLEEVRRDYWDGGAQLRTALDKFMEHPMVNLRSGSMIRVQVESVKRHKTEDRDKENLDPQNIPSRKTRKAGKKEHNLSKNVLKNQPN
ncbi:hypothetical protein C1646_774281, partial [Rhizophagus diaphanus]